MASLKEYYRLAKPGIIYGNAITAIAGFLLASKGYVNFALLLAMLVGISLVVASGCVFNNYIDRDIDAKMERTKHRALVKGTISGMSAIIYGATLFALGVLVLALNTNPLTVGLALGGFFFYVVVYSLWGKRGTVYGTVIGSISGAVPPVVGYCAVSNNFDLGAILLFVILILWQMPHFFAIAMYRVDEYAAAGIPVLPLKKGNRAAKLQMTLYIIAFIVTALLLTVFGYTGYVYFAVVAVFGLVWLGLCVQGFRAKDDKVWARKMFLFSLVMILLLSIMLSIRV
jgi:heme o synthase